MSCFDAIAKTFVHRAALLGDSNRGVFAGRRTTHDGATVRKPFIVREVRADMLKPHPVLSKGARGLWMTLLGMANAKTGELRHRDHWYSGKEIQRRAQVCHVLRKRFMRDLIAAGYVLMERIRVSRVIGGRIRSVLGETRYTVFKSPYSSCHSSTVNSVYRSRNLPTIPSKHHQEPRIKNHRDEFTRLEELKGEYLSRCEDPAGQIATALEIISERILARGIRVSGSAYLSKCVTNFFENEQDREELKRRLRMGPM